MQKAATRLICLLFAVILAVSALPAAYALETERTVSIPVTLSVEHTVRNIDVSLPAAMPVSVVDGKVMTADNLKIRNNSDTVSVKVASISVTNGQYRVVSFSGFSESVVNAIALRINGCETTGAGSLPITSSAFPEIGAGSSLPIRYSAKVTDSADVAGIKAANIIFTLKAG